jgi:hypothetical protein
MLISRVARSVASISLVLIPCAVGRPQPPKLATDKIQGIIVETQYLMSFGMRWVPYLALRDGSIYRNSTNSPNDLDVTRSKAREPQEWGTWKVIGDEVAIEWNNPQLGRRTLRKGWWFKGVRPPRGTRLAGRYGSLSSGGGVSSSKEFVFDSSGRFIVSTAGGASNPDIAAFLSEENAGTYSVTDYTLELRFNDGTIQRTLIYLFPEKNGAGSLDAIGIGNRSFIRQDARQP